MTGPAFVPPVAGRIEQIQATLASLAGGTAQAQAVPAGGSTFAAALADATAVPSIPTAAAPATAGGVVSAAWTIPWQSGPQPAAAQPAAAQPTAAQPTSPVAATGALMTRGVAALGFGDETVVEPLKGQLTQRFGPTSCSLEPARTVDGVHYAHYHDGLDIGAPLGTPVHAIAAGKVIFAGVGSSGAEIVEIRHADGSVSLYGHLERKLDVQVGDTVSAGQVIGGVGMTGNTSGPHLHLGILVHGKAVDPQPILDGGRLAGVASASAAQAPARSGWTASSPLAAATGKLTDAGLAAFDRVARTIPHHAEIRDAAVRAGIDPLLLASLVKAESGFRTDAVSSAGALGLCQLMPATAKAMGVTDPFDATSNLRAGARYLAHNLDLYGRTDLALAAYQAGKGAVARADGVPDYPVTHTYIDRILGSWGRYTEAAA